MDFDELFKKASPANRKLLEQLLDTFISAEFHDGERQQHLRGSLLQRFVATLMTDDERARYLGLPVGCRIRENAKIISPENLTCGEYVWIGEGAVLDASGGLEVGSHTSIGLSTYIWSHSSYLTNLTMSNVTGSPLIERKKTTIGSGCFIAGPTTILHGVTVGDKCVILPMSVVNKDIPSYSMVAGNPARVIKTIDEDYIEMKVKAQFDRL